MATFAEFPMDGFLYTAGDGFRKARSRFILRCDLETDGEQIITSTIFVQRQSHQTIPYSFHAKRETTVQLWDGLELKVNLGQQRFGEGSFLIDLKLNDLVVPKSTKTQLLSLAS